MANISDLQCGVAGEHLVCADLLLAGYRAFLADQNCPYDVAVEVGGRIIRIQVKTTREPRAVPQRVGHFPAYMWHVRRSGKRGARVYGDGEFDVLALVALDARRIAYLPQERVKRTIHIRTYDSSAPPSHGGKRGKTFAMFPASAAFSELVK